RRHAGAREHALARGRRGERPVRPPGATRVRVGRGDGHRADREARAFDQLRCRHAAGATGGGGRADPGSARRAGPAARRAAPNGSLHISPADWSAVSAPKILAVASAVDLDFRYGCTPAWWQLWKGLCEAGCDLIVTPYRGRAIESPWWRTE